MAAGAFQWFFQRKSQVNAGYLLDSVQEAGQEEARNRRQEQIIREEEEKTQAGRVFGLDFMITHGSAFGGCAATLQDGSFRKGLVPLDQIMMYGRQPSGKDFTYYIEDQDLMVCACDEKDALLVKADSLPFEIREAGLSRDQGVSVKSALIRKDVLYYIILESHHEISIRASGRC